MIEIVNPGWKILTETDGLVQHIERCGRTCYKSEDRITDTSAERFVRTICRNRHESVLEHGIVTVIIVCSRSCSHQLVRHRIAAYSQESQRYCDYGKRGLRVICPTRIGLTPGGYFFEDSRLNLGWFKYRDGPILPDKIEDRRQVDWLATVGNCYSEYLAEREDGVPPEDARYVLPNATKTEIATTFNLRQWRHVFRERGLNRHAQWEIRGIFSTLLEEFQRRMPSVFEDLT